MGVMVLDTGNSIIKAKIVRRLQGEIGLLLAIRQLSDQSL
jgi:hypothetical protein